MTEIVDHGVTGKIIREISEPVGLVMINCTFIEQSLSAIFEITADEVYAAGRKVKRPLASMIRSRCAARFSATSTRWPTTRKLCNQTCSSSRK